MNMLFIKLYVYKYIHIISVEIEIKGAHPNLNF